MEGTKQGTRHARRTAAERAAMAAAALDRAQSGKTCANDMILLVEFSARGIDAHPRHDVFTYAAWQALGRHVKKGEHGVAVPVYVDKETVNEDGTKDERTIRTTAHVFHISQTEPNEEPTPGVAITADGVAPCELFGDTLTLTGPVQPQEATT